LTRLPYATSHPLLASSWTLGPIGKVGTIKSRVGLKTTYFGVQVFGTMVPEEKYYVGPARDDKDEFGFAALEIKISFDQNVLDNMVRAREHLMQLMQDAGHKGAIREIVPTLVPGTAKHYGGAARMHAEAERAYERLDGNGPPGLARTRPRNLPQP
jgi:hypothetical protein